MKKTSHHVCLCFAKEAPINPLCLFNANLLRGEYVPSCFWSKKNQKKETPVGTLTFQLTLQGSAFINFFILTDCKKILEIKFHLYNYPNTKNQQNWETSFNYTENQKTLAHILSSKSWFVLKSQLPRWFSHRWTNTIQTQGPPCSYQY